MSRFLCVCMFMCVNSWKGLYVSVNSLLDGHNVKPCLYIWVVYCGTTCIITHDISKVNLFRDVLPIHRQYSTFIFCSMWYFGGLQV